mgnify:FL=1
MASYLDNLTARIATGLAALDEPTRRLHGDYLCAVQRDDGGFSGREGGGDLYYTGFALRGLAVLGRLEGSPAARAGDFLRGHLHAQVPVVDLVSLLYGCFVLERATGDNPLSAATSGWRDSVAQLLESLRRPDGGYARSPEAASGSMYHTFLVVLCQQLADMELVDAPRTVEFTLARRRQDGGFVQLAPMKRSGTNPTAAAVGLLTALDAMPNDMMAGTIEFLREMQTDEGGLRANTRIPIADLLSTFTGLVALGDLQANDAIDLNAARNYVGSLAAPDGGFCGAAWDSGHDVEYTFYGLGALALLSSP